MRNGKDRAIVTGNGIILGEHDMCAGTNAIFADIEVGSVSMGIEDHVSGAIYNTFIGIGCNVIKQLRDGIIGAFVGCCLLGANFAECNKYRDVNGARIEQEADNNFLDALDARVVQGRAVGRFSSILRFGAIVDFYVVVGRELMLGGNRMVVSEKDLLNIILYGEAESSLLVFLIKADAIKFFTRPIFGDGLVFFE